MKTPRRPGDRLVYSTDPEPEPEPVRRAYPPPQQQTARIARDRKRRRGKTVTVITGLQHDEAALEALLRLLKQQLGTGGTVKEAELEIQGDHRERVAELLGGMGYKVKFVGG